MKSISLPFSGKNVDFMTVVTMFREMTSSDRFSLGGSMKTG